MIEFAQATLMAPEEIRHEARARLEEIADGLQGLPKDSVFWESVRISQLRLIVGGWTFHYTLDGDTIRVTKVQPR